MLRGAKETSLRGEWHHPGQQAPFVCFCLYCLTIDMPLASFAQSVERVVQREGTFPRHAEQGNNWFPEQESDLLTTNNAAPAKPYCHSRHSMQWPFSHSFVDGASHSALHLTDRLS